jgi:hypothetical protein
MTATKYQLGRGLAAAQEAKLDHYDTPEADRPYELEQQIGREIEAAGGWDGEVQRGYDDARRDYATERTPW